MGSHWQNADDINAELRMLTKELRQLREELRGMITPPKRTRALFHRQSWRPAAPEPPVAEAADKPATPPRNRQKK